jgi:hypothetical protein
MAKGDEHLVLLVEDIDHTICNVVFECLVLNVYSNLSTSSTSTFKYVAFSYLHANFINIVGTTTITIIIKGGLIKTHAKFIKKGCFLQFENFFVKAKIDYDKGDFDWMIELSIATKVTTIPTFDLPVKLDFLPKDTIHSFSRCMLQPFATTTIAFVVIGVRGEIDNKVELLVIDGNNLKDIQIVSF